MLRTLHEHVPINYKYGINILVPCFVSVHAYAWRSCKWRKHKSNACTWYVWNNYHWIRGLWYIYINHEWSLLTESFIWLFGLSVKEVSDHVRVVCDFWETTQFTTCKVVIHTSLQWVGGTNGQYPHPSVLVRDPGILPYTTPTLYYTTHSDTTLHCVQ